MILSCGADAGGNCCSASESRAICVSPNAKAMQVNSSNNDAPTHSARSSSVDVSICA